MKFPLDDRPMLKQTIDVMMIAFALVTSLAGDRKAAELAAVERMRIVEMECDDGLETIKNLTGQLENARTKATNLAKDGEDKAGIIATLTAQLGEQGRQIGQMTTALDSLRPGGPCDAVFMIDTTGSTDTYHDHVKASLKALFRWAPRLSSELRIGVIPFRDGPLPAYPLQVIHPRHFDAGHSQDQLLAFIDDLRTEGSATDHLPVFRQALEMLTPSRAQNRRAVAILVGDIGPSELDGYMGFSSSEKAEAERIIAGVRSWVSGDMRSVASIYLGEGDGDSEDRQWFADLSLPDPNHFASDSSQMFNVILSTIEK